MHALTVAAPTLTAPDPQTLDQLREVDVQLLAQPQAEIPVAHLMHGGMYARTICIPAGIVASGVLLKRATMLIVNGDLTMFTGAEAVRFTGYHVLPGSAGRKALFRTHAETHMTMVLPSDAQSIGDAEHDFTSEPERLVPPTALDTVTITGEFE